MYYIYYTSGIYLLGSIISGLVKTSCLLFKWNNKSIKYYLFGKASLFKPEDCFLDKFNYYSIKSISSSHVLLFNSCWFVITLLCNAK